MLFDFATKVTKLVVTNPSSGGGSIYVGMSVVIFLQKVAHFTPEQVAHFTPEQVAHIAPE
jgi:hypothetical protein